MSNALPAGETPKVGAKGAIAEDAPLGETPKPYVRVATMKDLEKMVDVGCRAFQTDPVFNYFGNLKEFVKDDSEPEWHDRGRFLRFLDKGTFFLKGRVTVAVDPAAKDADGEPKIVACAFWQAPHKRLGTFKVRTIIRAGAIPMLKRWKWTGFTRITGDYQDTAHKKMEECFKAKGIKKPDIDASWYLIQVAVLPEYQGRGLMSMLVREAYAYAPNAVFTLEATKPKSRDQYTHLGFEHPTPILLGKGKCNKDGLRAKGADATGFEIWAMAKWPENKVQ